MTFGVIAEIALNPDKIALTTFDVYRAQEDRPQPFVQSPDKERTYFCADCDGCHVTIDPATAFLQDRQESLL